MKIDRNDILLLAVVLAVILWVVYSSVMGLMIKYDGEKVTALITRVPNECHKTNTITVMIENKLFNMQIRKEECREGIYSVGETVEVLKHKYFDELAWPNSNPELRFMLAVFMVAAAYLVRRQFLITSQS